MEKPWRIDVEVSCPVEGSKSRTALARCTGLLQDIATSSGTSHAKHVESHGVGQLNAKARQGTLRRGISWGPLDAEDWIDG